MSVWNIMTRADPADLDADITTELQPVCGGCRSVGPHVYDGTYCLCQEIDGRQQQSPYT